MRILCVTQRTCVRTLKQIIALSHNHDVHLVSKRLPTGAWCKTITYYDGTEASLRAALRLYKFVDIVYVHAEPASIVPVVRESLPSKKLVLDIHDAMIWRSTALEHRSAEERLAYAWADGIVVPSQSCRRELNPTVPTVVLPPYVNGMFYQNRSWGWTGGIVYQGRVDLPSQQSFMDYCKMEDTAKALKAAGIVFNLYVPGKDGQLQDHRKLYRDIAVMHRGLKYEELLSAMGFYDWGLCGNIRRYREWDLAMPNKLFDYLAGGIPVIALNAKETGAFVERHGVGISVSSIDELKERWDEREKCQRNVFLKRHKFTMDNHIHKVETLCKELIK